MEDYIEYIENWGKDTGESKENNCINVSVQMVTNFPELRLCIGYMAMDRRMVMSHCWVYSEEYGIIDPINFGNEVAKLAEYSEWDKKGEYVIADWCSMFLMGTFVSLYKRATGLEPLWVKAGKVS